MIGGNMRSLKFPALLASVGTMVSCAPKASVQQAGSPEKRLIARIHPSGFAQSHDTYNGMGTGSDGKVYYVLCSELPDVGARMYVYDPASGKSDFLGDLTEAAGEKGMNA